MRATNLGACLLLIGTIAFLEPLSALQTETGSQGSKGVERHYCTQFGPFFVRFDPDKAAGVFAIHFNGDLGAMVGVLDGRKLDGIWVENDSRGRIRMSFSDDFSTFRG